MENRVILESEFPNLKFVKRGKVRDLYEVGDNYLIVSTDRLSAFDVIMKQGIPYKGIVLNTLSKFWFDMTQDIIPNHIITTAADEYPEECMPYIEDLRGRSMLVRKAKTVPVECIVRGYITGSGWKDYQRTGQVCGIDLPDGLRKSQKLPEPIFTPSTKADIGEHDENISVAQAAEIVGKEMIERLEELSITIFKTCSDFAEQKGIIIADTKMEFGIDEEGSLILIDELMTPDSSRFWGKDKYEVGEEQDSFDKQIIRNYLLSINFNKQPPAPDLPEEIIEKTSSKYREVYTLLTGETI